MGYESRFLRSVLSRVRADDLLADGSILIAATFLSGFIHYLYQIAMGRLLGPAQYGVFGALFALSYLLVVFSRAVQLSATRYVSDLSAGRRAGFLRGFGARITALMAVLFAGLWVASPTVADLLHIADPFLVVIIGVSLFFGPIHAVAIGALRGDERFVAMGGVQVGKAVVKLAAGIGLVLLGYGVYGAVVGPAVAIVVVFAATVYYLRSWLVVDGSFGDYAGVYRFVGPSLFVAFCTTVPTNADVVVVKHLFSSVQAGLFTAVSVYGKVLIFLPAGITGALFPKAIRQTETRSLLHRGLLYTGVCAAGGAGVLVAWPDRSLSLLYGPTYAAAAPVLRWYAVALAAFSLCVVLLNYALAVGDLRFVKGFTALTVAEVALFYLLGTSVLRVAQVMLAVNAGAFVVGYLLFFSPWTPLRVAGGEAS